MHTEPVSTAPDPAVPDETPETASPWLVRAVGWWIDQKLVAFLLLALLVLVGVRVAPFGWQTPVPSDPLAVDAIPDIGENQQIVFTDWEGRSPEDVESQVTWPLSVALLGVPGVRTVRSISEFGFSSVFVIFEEDADFYDSRSRILERLASLPMGSLPSDALPRLGPDATALGQVYWYTLQGQDAQGRNVGGWEDHELRALQDFTVRYALAAAAGVAEVASIGGYVRELQIDVDPGSLRRFDVTLDEVMRAVQGTNLEVGAGTTENNGVEYAIRATGWVRSPQDVDEAAVAVRDDAVVRVRDVARVQWGPAERRGALDDGGQPAVGGVVVARHGANPMEVIASVNEALVRLQPALPTRTLADGTVAQVRVVPFYDRSALIDRTLGTLEDALAQQMLLTVLVVVWMMLHLRSSVLISLLLPIAVLGTFGAMKTFGVAANVVALAGIAVAIGTMVDIGIVLTEAVVRAVGEDRDALVKERGDPHAALDSVGLRNAIARGAATVIPAVMTALATTVVSFLPVFALEGQEGRLFGPLAFTKTWALVFSLVVAVLGIPALAHVLLAQSSRAFRWGARIPRMLRLVPHVGVGIAAAVWLALIWQPLGVGETGLRQVVAVALVCGGLLALFRLFATLYPRLLRWVLAHRAAFFVFPVLLLCWGAAAWQGVPRLTGWLPDTVRSHPVMVRLAHDLPGLGREFMPQLQEGDFLYMPSTMPHGSVGEVLSLLEQMDARIAAIPEVTRAVGKLGRAESALDPAPVAMIETVISFLPEYVQDEDGRVLRIAHDDDGLPIRTEAGEWQRDPEGRPHRQWRPEIRTVEDLWDEVTRAADVPGLTGAPLLQPISARVVMLQSGIRANLAVRLTGPSLDNLEAAARLVEDALRDHPAVRAEAVNTDRSVGRPYLRIDPDRAALARFGLSVEDLHRTTQAAVGGMVVGSTIDGRQRFNIRVRYPRELRDTPDAIAEVLVGLPGGAQVPLGQLASVSFVEGPSMIRGENGVLVGYVMFDGVAGISQIEVVEAVQAELAALVTASGSAWPDGVEVLITGAWENAVRARARLALLIPLALLVVFVLLYLQFRSVVLTATVFAGIAVSLAGGFVMLWAWGQPAFLDVDLLGHNLRDIFHVRTVNLSVAVWVGFIALFGIATDDGVVMATYLQQQFAAAPARTVQEIRARVLQAGLRRIRPCLMTTATTLLALLPVLTSTGTGADVLIPMALPAFGGMTFALMTLFIVPALFALQQELVLRHSLSRRPQ